MKPINNLADLFIELLKNRYDSEQQQIEAFPELMEEASSTALKNAIQTSINRSKIHFKKIVTIFNSLKVDPVDDVCEGCLVMINDAWKLIRKAGNKEIKDAALITAIQHIHHYDIAGYGSLSAYAIILGYDEIAHELHEMLDEEKNLDEILKEVALNSVNKKANKEIVL
ncbi:MAG: DUF892 family protein [Flammeovirgaceae bacterium]|nr:DUF892 family protein [Flammeovirgaceae bacterium]